MKSIWKITSSTLGNLSKHPCYTLNLLCAAEVTLITIPAWACCSLIVTPKKWAHCFSTCIKKGEGKWKSLTRVPDLEKRKERMHGRTHLSTNCSSERKRSNCDSSIQCLFKNSSRNSCLDRDAQLAKKWLNVGLKEVYIQLKTNLYFNSIVTWTMLRTLYWQFPNWISLSPYQCPHLLNPVRL